MLSFQMKSNKRAQIIISQILVILMVGASQGSCLGWNVKDAENDLPEDPGPSQEITAADPENLPVVMTPAGEIYAVTGLRPDENLTIYREPSKSAEILNQIHAFGTGLRPVSDIQILAGASWIQVQYKDQTGWVNYNYLAEQHGSLGDDLVKLGLQTLTALKEFQYDQLQEIIHPDLCLRFSPYSFLNTDNRIICKSDLHAEALSKEENFWGHYDGKGNPINLTFSSYHQKFVYDQEYGHAPVIGFDQEVSSGNSINNIQEIYPDGIMIEYYFPGIDPHYGGLDWRSIRLVFVQQGADWYLAAIVHGEWTI